MWHVEWDQATVGVANKKGNIEGDFKTVCEAQPDQTPVDGFNGNSERAQWNQVTEWIVDMAQWEQWGGLMRSS